MSIYIHIPFCSTICSYCDFCKIFYNKNWVKKYLIALKKEIKKNYQGEKVKTIYIGGGTPSALSNEELLQLFSILEIFNLDQNAEITIEANSEDLTESKLSLLKKHVNRLSIGVQTFNKDILKTLNRKLNINNLKLALQTFDNVNIDLMYGFQNQTLKDLKEDLNILMELKPKHISAYCLILEKHTKFYLKHYEPVEEDQERQMYELIVKTLKENNYIHYEFSNFARPNYTSKHNLVYWLNQHYYGFGLGASGYLKNIRYENTRSLTNYLKGKYLLKKHHLSLDETVQNEFILGLRKIDGINKNNFYNKYKVDIKKIPDVQKLLSQNILLENKDNIYINEKYLYTSNEVLLNFIDLSLHKH